MFSPKGFRVGRGQGLTTLPPHRRQTRPGNRRTTPNPQAIPQQEKERAGKRKQQDTRENGKDRHENPAGRMRTRQWSAPPPSPARQLRRKWSSGPPGGYCCTPRVPRSSTPCGYALEASIAVARLGLRLHHSLLCWVRLCLGATWSSLLTTPVIDVADAPPPSAGASVLLMCSKSTKAGRSLASRTFSTSPRVRRSAPPITTASGLGTASRSSSANAPAVASACRGGGQRHPGHRP